MDVGVEEGCDRIGQRKQRDVEWDRSHGRERNETKAKGSIHPKPGESEGVSERGTVGGGGGNQPLLLRVLRSCCACCARR